MKKLLPGTATAIVQMMLVLGFAGPARAALDVGRAAPMFSTQAALGGKPFKYALADALAKGPVVVYFFPAAFSKGCSIEAHAFAEAMDRFAAAGATVIGVSTDDIQTLAKFSSEVCQGRFPVASDESKSISQSFDAMMETRPDYATRVSYALSRDGKVAAVYQSLDPDQHVEKMLEAVKSLSPGRAGK
ncbi:Putative peroxiredoxin bcp [Variovorax sp. SRS16]|uniref:peroxiredoxin n=1 Tax=Variovorax sp. SRS16 TaxID=282217 RepID=UPI001315D10B|nr:peroxiredoxin [Variovorax sp. SRS16]VTU23816.1 Putative peroxiredoxin bcp [Variovorax sp. SRS16]